MHCIGALTIALLLLGSSTAMGDVYTLDSAAKWQSWDMPKGTVRVLAGGQIELVKFNKSINAAVNAANFMHPTQKRGDVRGGIWRAGSNAAEIGRAHV